jgi:hypothetical protein
MDCFYYLVASYISSVWLIEFLELLICYVYKSTKLLILGSECLIAKKEAKSKGAKSKKRSFLEVYKFLGNGVA